MTASAESPIEAFDAESSAATLVHCASILALVRTAVEDASVAAAPFFNFTQKARIRALATNLEPERMVSTLPSAAPVAAPQLVEGGLSAEEIERIVAHRVELAVQQMLQQIGLAPDRTLSAQLDQELAARLTALEIRLTEATRRQVDEVLDLVEAAIDERLGQTPAADEPAPADDVDARVQEAREAMMKEAEIREGHVEFNIDAFAADIADVVARTSADRIMAVSAGVVEAGDGDAAEADGGEAIELGDGETIELGDGGADDAGGVDQLDADGAGRSDPAGAEAEGTVDLGGEDGDFGALVELGADEAVVGSGGPEAGASEDAEAPLDDAHAAPGDAADGGDDAVFDDALELEPDDGAPSFSLGDADAGEETVVLSGRPRMDDGFGDLDLDRLDELDGAVEDRVTDELPVVRPTVELGSAAEFVELPLASVDADGEDLEVAVGDGGDDEADAILGEVDVEEAIVADGAGEAGDAEGSADDGAAEAVGGASEAESATDGELALEPAAEDEGADAVVLDADSVEDVSIVDEIEIVEVDLAGAEGAPLESGELELEEEGGSVEVDRYLAKAAEMRRRGQPTVAVQLYQKVLDIDPQCYEAQIGLGVVFLDQKDYKQATDAFSAAEAIDSERPGSHLGLAEVHFKRKQFNKAIRFYTRVLKLDEGVAQAHMHRGLCHYYQKNYKKAFFDLYNAYQIDENLPNIKKYLKLVQAKVNAAPGT